MGKGGERCEEENARGGGGSGKRNTIKEETKEGERSEMRRVERGGEELGGRDVEVVRRKKNMSAMIVLNFRAFRRDSR